MGEYDEKGSTVMAKELLDVKQLFVNVEDKEILHGVDLKIGKGETHVLMGPNGAGKSTLGYALMGNPRYQLTNGEIWFQGKKINEEPVDKRAKAGMFLSFQSPLEVPGLSLSSFIRSALEQRRGERIRLWDFRKELAKAMELLQMDSKPIRLVANSLDIARLDAVLEWIYLVDNVDQRWIIWQRAKRYPWRLICKRYGKTSRTLIDWHNAGIDVIVKVLNNPKSRYFEKNRRLLSRYLSY